MSALTQKKNTLEMTSKTQSYPIAANAVILEGAVVVLNASGYLTNATETTGLKCVGVAGVSVDNTGGANGAVEVPVRTGDFKLVNNGADALLITDVNATAYLLDNQTATKTVTGRSAAGKVVKVLSDGVVVRLGPAL